MQETSELYKEIVSADIHGFEYKLVLENVGTIGQSEIFQLDTDGKLNRNLPEIGKAVAGEVNLEIIMPSREIPKMAKIQPFFRAVGKLKQSVEQPTISDGILTLPNTSLVNDIIVFSASSGAYVDEQGIINWADFVYVDAESEWLPHGVYYVDTREESEHRTKQTLIIHGYDAMLMFEQDYPDTNHSWPYPDIDVIEEICQTVGIDVDERVYDYITAGHMVNLPTGYSMREKLEQIAGIYGGNFVMSVEGKLLFVPLYGFEPEIEGNYLADENGNALVFGEEDWFILV